MVETIFTTDFRQGPIPEGFHIQLEGNFIALIGQNMSGKTSLLKTIFRKNMQAQIGGEDQICLIPYEIGMEDQREVQTLEQYNSELAKSIATNNVRDRGPNAGQLFRLLLNHHDFKTQVLQLNSYLEYLDLPKLEIEENSSTVQIKQLLRYNSAIQTIITILAALTDDCIKLVLIDDPEVHLHPQLQKKLRELLHEASKKKQIIITTHSNVFINDETYISNYFISQANKQFSIRRASSESQLEGISAAEVKLIKLLTKTFPALFPNLLTSFAIERDYAAKLEDAKKLADLIQEKSEKINVTVFYENLLSSIEITKSNLARRRKERSQQANISYYVALVCLILGVLLVFIGVVFIFMGRLEGGVLTTVSSVISSLVSGLAFAFNKQINDIEREDSKELKTLEKSYVAMGLISCITDAKKRDELIQNLVENHYFDK